MPAGGGEGGEEQGSDREAGEAADTDRERRRPRVCSQPDRGTCAPKPQVGQGVISAGPVTGKDLEVER